jgi:DNA-binding transcriptional regulator YiaG
MIDPPTEWGRQLRAARKAAGLSQPQCDAALDCHTGATAGWERGRGTPHLLLQEAALWRLMLSFEAKRRKQAETPP